MSPLILPWSHNLFSSSSDSYLYRLSSSQANLPGAFCPGGETIVDLVVALRGWWRFNVTGDHWACVGRNNRLSTCPNVVPCLPASACLGNNLCSAPYDGDRCSNCATGFYRNNGNCVPCPSSPWAIIIGFLLIAAAGTAGGTTCP